MTDKTNEFLQTLSETEKALNNAVTKAMGKIEMIQDIRNYFETMNLQVVGKEESAAEVGSSSQDQD